MNQPAILVSTSIDPGSERRVANNLFELSEAVALLLRQYSTVHHLPRIIYKREGDVASLSLDVAIQTLAPEFTSTEREAFAIAYGLGYMSKSTHESGEVFFAY